MSYQLNAVGLPSWSSVSPPGIRARPRTEIYWITANGLKKAGMPGFNFGIETADRWAIVAFVYRMNGLSLQEFQLMVMAADGRPEAETMHWIGELRASPRHIFARYPERGKELVRFVGYKRLSHHSWSGGGARHGWAAAHSLGGAPVYHRTGGEHAGE